MENIPLEKIPEILADLLEKVARLENKLNQEMLTTDEAAAYLRISRSSLYKMNMQGTLPIYRPGGKRIYFRRSDLNAYLTSSSSSK